MQHLLQRGLSGPAVAGFALGLLLAAPALAQPTIEKSVKVAPGGLYELVFSPSTKTIWVAATGPRGSKDAKVVGLDAATLDKKGEISLGDDAVFGLGLNDATQTLYGTSTRDGELIAIDLKAGKAAATIKHGDKAHLREAVVDEAGGRVFASAFGNEAQPERPSRQPGGKPIPAREAVAGQVWIVDAKTNAVAQALDAGVGTAGLAFDAKTERVYTTDLAKEEVVVLDLKTKAVSARYPTGGEGPINLALDPDGRRVFVANQKSGTLTVLGADDGKVIKSVPTGDGALSVAFDGGRNLIYVANRRAGTVSVVDGKSYEQVASLATGTFPQTIAVDRASGLVYVSNKARGAPRDAPRDQPPPEDPNGDTVTLIRP